jgi:hypothetical protein
MHTITARPNPEWLGWPWILGRFSRPREGGSVKGAVSSARVHPAEQGLVYTRVGLKWAIVML